MWISFDRNYLIPNQNVILIYIKQNEVIEELLAANEAIRKEEIDDGKNIRYG